MTGLSLFGNVVNICRAGALLGKGGFGTVQTVVHKQSGVKYALKVRGFHVRGRHAVTLPAAGART